jgi:D-alanyl-D-alanine carboxypeptidase (penicillin-binding protein 5/6)
MLLLVSWQSGTVHAATEKGHKKAHVSSNTSKSKSGEKKKRHSRSSRRKAPIPDDASALHLNVKSAFLINAATGKVYFAQDADERIPPASITKVLTLYVVRDALAQGKIKDSTPIPVSALAIRTGGSTMSLYKGEKVPLSEIIKGISVVSANNACVAVAEYLGKGDSRRFVGMMNSKAKSLGMGRSVFRNPNGLPATGQVSTARDIAKLSASYLKHYPESLAIHSMTSHTYHGVAHHNANSLLGRYEGADGLKTGFVCASGYNITATAKRGNTRLIAVVMGARNPIIREVETSRLLDFGFAQAANDPVPTIPAPAAPKERKPSGKHSRKVASRS